MLTSLRARLWLSYALLIGVMLGVVAVVLVQAILRNPQVYRSTLPRLRQAAVNALPEVNRALDAGPARLQAALAAAGDEAQLRMLVTDPAGRVIADSWSVPQRVIRQIDPADLAEMETAERPGLLRDARGRAWLYTSARAAGGHYLVTAMQLPRLPVLTLLRNEVVAPIMLAGAAAFVISFLLALLMARWIASPLQRMQAAAHRMAAGADAAIPEEGPDEIRDLARSLNDMNRKVRAGQQTQRDFIANVSHELKTPLTSVQGFAQAVLDGTAATPEAAQDAARVIYQEATRMHRLVLDLLALTRLEGGTADLQSAPVDLAGLLEGVAGRLGPLAAQHQVELACQAAGPLQVVGDSDRLAQVFTNLVDNAIKFTPPGGKVSIQAREQGGSVLVEVADTGPGIAPEERERIFERFYQADASRRGGSERGTGLGLPIARQIVLAHGGKIWVESQPGFGSRFYVELPLHKAVR